MKNIKESISNILEMGGTVEFPYKSSIADWYSNTKIYRLEDKKGYFYIVDPRYMNFYDINEAIDFFMDLSMSSKNKALVFKNLIKKNLLTNEDFYNLEHGEISDKLKKLDKKESKLIDEDFKKYNIKLKPIPNPEDALNEVKEIVKETNVDQLRNKLIEFEKKYNLLKVSIIVHAFYNYKLAESDELHDYSACFDYEDINEETINKYKILNSSNYEMNFQFFKIIFNINNKYEQFELKI